MSHDGDVLRAAADALPDTLDPWGWLCARAHELDLMENAGPARPQGATHRPGPLSDSAPAREVVTA